MDDARALTWSTDFSDALGRSQGEIKNAASDLAVEIHGAETESVPLETRLPVRAAARAARTGSPLRPMAWSGARQGLEGDWPYLAF